MNISLKQLKKWIVTILVFWGVLRMLFFILTDLIFRFITIPDRALNNIVQMVSLVVVVLLSIILTALLVSDHKIWE